MRPFPPPAPSEYLWLRIRKRWLRNAIASAALAACAAVLLHRPLLIAAGRWLCVSVPMDQPEVIIVLAGDAGGRVSHGVDLYRRQAGPKPRILMSGGPLGLTTWAELMKRQAMGLGIPEGDIWVQDRSTSTTEDALFSVAILRSRGVKRACLATSNFHSRRALGLFRRAWPEGEVGCDPETPPWWDGRGWWRKGLSAGIVFSEFTKLAVEALGVGPT